MPSKYQREPTNACPSCGSENTLGRPFCTSCGTPMFRDGKPRLIRHHRGGPARGGRNALIALVVVAAAVALILSCWPFPPTGPAGNTLEAPVLRQALSEWTQAAQPGQVPVTRVITETQWNGYARSRINALRETPGYGSYWHRYPTDLRVDARPDKIVLVATERLGPFDSSTRVVLIPDGEPKRYRLQSLWRGHLPLPLRFADSITQSLSARFGLDLPPVLWDSLRIVKADDQRMAITSSPVSPPTPQEAPHAR